MGINRIEQAQDVVRMAEKGELHWLDLLMGPDSGDRFSEIPNVLDRFGEVYARVRMTEAAAYRFREEHNTPERRLVESRVRQITDQRGDIEQLGAQVDEMTLDQLAELGRFFARQQVAWALGIVDKSLPGWGY